MISSNSVFWNALKSIPATSSQGISVYAKVLVSAAYSGGADVS